MQDALEGLDEIEPIHDDILIYGSGENDKEAEEDHDRKIYALLQRCVEKNIKLNKDKLKLKVDSVAYLGFVISKEGLRQKWRLSQKYRLHKISNEYRDC